MSDILNCFNKRMKYLDYSSDILHSKDSFDRFGDDLCELILSYLSFDNKISFECVSTQFQRVIFKSVDSININHQRLSSLIAPFHYKKSVNIEVLKIVLKKCQNIRKVYSAEEVINEEEVFKAVIDSCNDLKEIESDFESLTDDTIDEFCAKFGPKLKKINFIPNNSNVKKILKSSPNLEMIGYDWISLDHFFDGNNLLVNRLKSFSFYYFSEDIERISTFVKSNRNSLTSLEMIVYDKSLTTFHTKTLFDKISDLINLKSIGIFYYVTTDTSFVGFIEDLSDKYPKLKRVDFDLRINNSSDLLNVIKSFNRFKGLKSICLKNHSNQDIQLTDISSESLKGCKDLTHLKIIGNTFQIRDQFFTSIDKYLPKLLTFNSNNADISRKGLQLLSKMSNLRTLTLISKSLVSSIIETDIFEFILKCPKIISFYFINCGISYDFDYDDIQSFKAFTNSMNFHDFELNHF